MQGKYRHVLEIVQCEWGRPVPHMPQLLGTPVHWGADSPATLEAKTESFLCSLVEPQAGQAVPFQFEERTRISLSLSQASQWNS
jgi:hypothetical protein